MTVLGLDIGGANIKAATSVGKSAAFAFPLWRHPDQLAQRIGTILQDLGGSDQIALTMTGELADCFHTKSVGVNHIVAAVVEAAGETPVAVWTTRGEFVSPDDACRRPTEVAAANWHALTTWTARQFPESHGLMIDIGSTTTDIIPFRNGRSSACGSTDLQRLQTGELVYTGVRRTPLCAVAAAVSIRGQLTPVAAELFATTLDVYLWLGQIAEEPDNVDTANGKPATRAAAGDRLARMVCCDADELAPADVDCLAAFWSSTQRTYVVDALRRVIADNPQVPEIVVLSGSGEFLAERVLSSVSELAHVERYSITKRWGAKFATAACAAAVASLLEAQTPSVPQD